MENKEIVELENKALAVDEQAKAMIIKSQEQYNAAGDFIKSIKGIQKQVKDTFKEIIAKTFAAHKEAKAQETRHLEPLLKAEEFIKAKMISYTDEQERLRRIEQEKLERKAAEERRIKAEQEAEWRRKEEEKRKEADRLTALAAKEKNAKARAEAEAAAAKARAKADKAAAKADDRAFEQQNIVAPVAAPKVEAVKGVSYRDSYSAEVTDFEKLPDDYKVADMTKLNKVAQATKGTLSIPGVKWNKEKIMSSRAA